MAPVRKESPNPGKLTLNSLFPRYRNYYNTGSPQVTTNLPSVYRDLRSEAETVRNRQMPCRNTTA